MTSSNANIATLSLVNLHAEARELSARGALASMAPEATRITQGLFDEVPRSA